MKKVRCAIYTRKSSEEGLDQDFNSLDAQREACEAYVASQKHEGWVVLAERYDDGGVSGGTLERSGLQRLLKAIDDGLVDQIIVYKIDRLTRSLMDFSRLIERLDAADASFVSVTQSFNTATSMGRLTLNVLLSFAQFEREVTAERIRDKIAASKKKGMWMGGPVPLGYRTEDRNLIIETKEAATVRQIYDLYLEHKSVRALKQAADRLGLVSRCWITKAGKAMGGQPYSRGHLYRILTNPLYIGKVSHKGKTHGGLHQGIVNPDKWNAVQTILEGASAKPRTLNNGDGIGDIGSRKISNSLPRTSSHSSPLAGKLYDETGDRLTPSHANKKGRRYRYYVSNRLIKKSGEKQTGGGWRLPAQQLEKTISAAVQDWLANPSQVRQHVYPDDPSADCLQSIITSINDLQAAMLNDCNPINLISAAIEKITIGDGSLTVQLKPDQLILLLKLVQPTTPLNERELVIIQANFQHRKRGVESKLILGTKGTTAPDRVLISNIAKAKAWLQRIQSGCSIAEIATNEGRSIKQIQRHLELAFLSPTIARMITEGTQPPELTSRQLINTSIPIDWNKQLQQFGIN